MRYERKGAAVGRSVREQQGIGSLGGSACAHRRSARAVGGRRDSAALVLLVEERDPANPATFVEARPLWELLSELRSSSESIPGSIGLSSSSVSRAFVDATSAKLREFQERDLSGAHYVAIFLDGKTLAETTMVVALDVKITGEMVFLGFVETHTENSDVPTPFLRSPPSRGLDISRGILAIIDGGKGLRKAVRKAFKKRCLVQRCQWHKRKNVVKHLPRAEQKNDRPSEGEA
jgi:hypothetical protein